MNEVFYASDGSLYYIIGIIGLFIFNRILKLLVHKPNEEGGKSNMPNIGELKSLDEINSDNFDFNDLESEYDTGEESKVKAQFNSINNEKSHSKTDFTSSISSNNKYYPRSESPFDFIDEPQNMDLDPSENSANTGSSTGESSRGVANVDNLSKLINVDDTASKKYISGNASSDYISKEMSIINDSDSLMNITLDNMSDYEDDDEIGPSLLNSNIDDFNYDDKEESLLDDFDARRAIIASEIIGKRY